MSISLPQRLACLSNETLHLIILPTEACNFRCVYCYEEFRYKRMEPWVVRGIENWIAHRAPGLKSLSLSWFGGEPLLARDLMERLLHHARALAENRFHLSSDITTNGYLLSASAFARLLELRVTEYQISFDGPREWHDRKRVLHGGKGTFDRIWSNMQAMRAVDGVFTVTVRVHVDRENASSMPEFVEKYERDFGSDSRFELYIRPLSRLGGPNDAALQVFESAEGARVIESVRSLVSARGLNQRSTRTQESICYAARANSFVVRANGRLNKCTVALEHPNNQVGFLREDGTVHIESEKMVMWMRGLRDGNTETLKCPMNGYAEPAHAPAPAAAEA